MLLFTNNKCIIRIYLRSCNCYFQNWQGKNLDIWLVSELKRAVTWLNQLLSPEMSLKTSSLHYSPTLSPTLPKTMLLHSDITRQSPHLKHNLSFQHLQYLLCFLKFPFLTNSLLVHGHAPCFLYTFTSCFLINMQLRETFRKKADDMLKLRNLGSFAFFVLLVGKTICCRSEKVLYYSLALTS